MWKTKQQETYEWKAEYVYLHQYHSILSEKNNKTIPVVIREIRVSRIQLIYGIFFPSITNIPIFNYLLYVYFFTFYLRFFRKLTEAYHPETLGLVDIK